MDAADVKVQEGTRESAAEGAGNGSAPVGPNGTGAGVSLRSNDVRRKRPPAFSFFAVIYVGSLRAIYEWATGAILRAAGYRRRTVLVGSGEQIEAVANALSSNGGHAIELVGYSSLTPRPENGLRSLGPVEDLPAVLERERVDEVLIADPAF